MMSRNMLDNYFSKRSSLPNPRGSLSCSVPSSAAANKEVSQVISEGRKKRGPYHKYLHVKELKLPSIQWKMVYLLPKGNFLRSLVSVLVKIQSEDLKLLTWKNYLENVELKMKSPKKRGRPLMLGERLDSIVY